MGGPKEMGGGYTSMGEGKCAIDVIFVINRNFSQKIYQKSKNVQQNNAVQTSLGLVHK